MSTVTPHRRNIIVRGAALLAVIAITALIVIYRERVAEFATLGLPGIFLVAMVGSATVILPVPHLAFTFAMGSVFNPWLVGLLAGAGDTVGELSGYVAGFAFENVADNLKLYRHFEHWMQVNGDLTLFLLSLIPNPLFDMASIAGGLAGFPVRRFLWVTWAGKTLKSMGIAWAGYYGVQWVVDVFG